MSFLQFSTTIQVTTGFSTQGKAANPSSSDEKHDKTAAESSEKETLTEAKTEVEEGGGNSPVAGETNNNNLSSVVVVDEGVGTKAPSASGEAPGPRRTMDFLNRGKMAAKGKLSKLIYVKPYPHAQNYDEEDEDGDGTHSEGEKENLAAQSNLPRTRSLEQLPSAHRKASSVVLDQAERRMSYETGAAPPKTLTSTSLNGAGSLHKSPIRRRLNW